MSYAEAFQAFYPEGYTHLPANEHLLKLARTPIGQAIQPLRIQVHESNMGLSLFLFTFP